jgi:BASS family bile acid:Na+ symporter
MSIATLIPLVLKASIFLAVFALGLNATLNDALYLLRRPGHLIRALVAMNVIMPIVAMALSMAYNFTPAVQISLVALALSPVPPIFPNKGFKAGGRSSYTIGLLVAIGLLSIVVVPVAAEIVRTAFGKPTYLSPSLVAKVVFMSVLLPLSAGIAVRHFAPQIAERFAKPLNTIAMIILILGILPILFTAWPAITSLVGNGTILAFVIFVIIALATGHLLGGPDPDDRTVLALSTAARHPAIAMALAHAYAPDNKLVLAAVLLYLLVNTIVSIPYMNWRKRQHAGLAGMARA